MLMSPSRRTAVEKLPHYYPFGSNRVRNVVKDFSYGFGDLDIYSIKILFLGCADLMKTLHVSTAENVQQFQIHLNDMNPSILARNIMVLKIISAPDFNPQKDEDVLFLWDIWYNATWPETTRKRFLGILRDLVNEKLPQNVIIPDDRHLQSIKKVWSSWRKILTENSLESTILIQKISIERVLFIWTGWGVRFPEEFAKEIRLKNGDSISAAVNGLVEEVESNLGIESLTDQVREKIRDEITLYFESGNCRVKDTYEVCVNPTMLDPTDLSWQVFHRLCPFDSYLPLVKQELSSSKSWILIRSCQKILKNLVFSYRTRIQDINIFCHLQDPLEFCYSYPDKFDIIDCSNLPDQLGLVNIINACIDRLAQDTEAMLFTETLKWMNLSSSVKEYVEKALCAPLSMIPTIYGLRLVDRVELGASALVNLRCKMAPLVHLCWQKVPSFQNLNINSSPELDRFLDQLADKCFDISFPRELNGTHPGDGCGMLCYTPLTFDYVVNSMINRVGGDCWLNDDRKCSGWNSNFFDLAKRTAKAWRKDQPILNLTAKMQVCPDHVLSDTATLRLVLFPCATFQEASSKGKVDFSGPDIHMIDNIKIETKKIPDGSEIVIVSFLLPADHGLENTHLAFLLDLEDGTVSYVFKSLRYMRAVKFRQPHPFKRPEQLPLDASGQLQMVVFSCTESVNDYRLKISIPCGDTVSSVHVSTNRIKPCECAHEITITPDQPNDIEPLTLSFTYPFDEIHIIHHEEARLINLVLKKALLEPWPQDFEADQTKWNADRLKPWEEKKARVHSQDRSAGIPSLSASCLAVHVACQFNLHKLPKPSKIEKSDLNAVRNIIKFLFQKCVGENPSGMSYVRILLDGSPEEHPDWYLKVHHPIRTSPQGSPMLLISAFDNKFVEQAKKNEENSNKLEVTNDFFRVFPTWNPEETLTIKVDAVELLKLLRSILRINSTKIEPSTWQKNNLRLEGNSPWLATFISPLYLDAPLDKKKVKPKFIFTLIKIVTIIFFIGALLYGVGFLFWYVLSCLFWYALSFFKISFF